MLPEESEFLVYLYHQHFSTLYGHAVKLLKLHNFDAALFDDLAEELVQDTFHTASEKIEVLMSHPNPGGWLMCVLKNKFKAFLRQHYSDQRLVLMSSLPIDMADPSSPIDSAQLDLECAEDMQQIRQALSPTNFRIFEQVALNHVSHQAMAQELDISIWDSQKRLERARKTLRKIFAKK